MSETEEMNAEDQAEESLEAPVEENTEEPVPEEEVGPEENEEVPAEDETEQVNAEDEVKDDDDVEVNRAFYLCSKHCNQKHLNFSHSKVWACKNISLALFLHVLTPNLVKF